MSEKVREEGSHAVTSNKHLEQPSQPTADEELMGYKGGAAQGVTLPGAGRPDGPSDDGSSGGPLVGGAWGGMQADGKDDESVDEAGLISNLNPPREILGTERIDKTGA